MADPENAEKMPGFTHVDKDRGRIEIREATVCRDIREIRDKRHWPGLKAVGKVAATRETEGKSTTETRYFLLSSKLDPERFPATVRAHWSVENSLHRAFDAAMNEDAQRKPGGLRRRKSGSDAAARTEHRAGCSGEGLGARKAAEGRLAKRESGRTGARGGPACRKPCHDKNFKSDCPGNAPRRRSLAQRRQFGGEFENFPFDFSNFAVRHAFANPSRLTA